MHLIHAAGIGVELRLAHERHEAPIARDRRPATALVRHRAAGDGSRRTANSPVRAPLNVPPIDLIHIGRVPVDLPLPLHDALPIFSRDHRCAPPEIRRRATPDPRRWATYVGHWNVAAASAASSASAWRWCRWRSRARWSHLKRSPFAPPL